MRVTRRTGALTLIAVAGVTALAACGGGGSGAGVDRTEGTAAVTIDGQSAANQPLTCPNHTTIGPLGTSGGPGSYSFKAMLQSSTTARIEVIQNVYKAEPVTYTGTAAVHIDSDAGPTGSLTGHVNAGSAGAGGAGSLDVSARFQCSANGGGVYTGRADLNEHQDVVLYFTVSHDGSEVVDLIAAPQSSAAQPLPNVQLRGRNIPVDRDGTFRLSTTLTAADGSGVAAAGRRATLTGTLDRTGSASGTISYPSQVTAQPVTWEASIAGPIAVPEFPHAPLDTKLISKAQVASDPAINLLYPGSTNEDGSAPGPPFARAETQQDQWAHMEFAPPSGGEPAEADRAQQTQASVYDVAAWYQQQLTALGWQTATTTNYGNVPSLVFLDGTHRLLVVEFSPRPAKAPSATHYQLVLREAAQASITVNRGLSLGPPQPPIEPCVPIQPASISISGTVTGTASSLCSVVGAESAPRCSIPTVGFAVGQVRFVVWGPPYSANGITITGPHLEASGAAAVDPLQVSVSNGALHMSGRFSGGGYDETVDVSTTCAG